MAFFAIPNNVSEAYGISRALLQYAGLFPFYYDLKHQKFMVSWKYRCITAIHIVIYTYVNVTSIMENWRDYSQPMIGNSSLSALGNLALRLLGIVITFCVMLPQLLGIGDYLDAINLYVQAVDEIVLLGINVSCVYRRIYYFTLAWTAALAGLICLTAWHSIYFYEHITQRPPELKYYLVVSLSFIYKAVFLFYSCIQLIGIYLVSSQLNKYLIELKEKYRQIYEEEIKAQSEWKKSVKIEKLIKNL